MNSTEYKDSGHGKPPSSLCRLSEEVPSATILRGLLSPKSGEIRENYPMKKRTGRKTTISGLDTLAGRIVAARTKRNWSQEELAVAAGCTPAAVAKIEAGNTRNPRNMDKLAAALGESPGWLLFGEPPAEKSPDVDQEALRDIIDQLRAFAAEKRLNLTSTHEATMIAALYRATVSGDAPLSEHLITAILQAIQTTKT